MGFSQASVTSGFPSGQTAPVRGFGVGSGSAHAAIQSLPAQSEVTQNQAPSGAGPNAATSSSQYGCARDGGAVSFQRRGGLVSARAGQEPHGGKPPGGRQNEGKDEAFFIPPKRNLTLIVYRKARGPVHPRDRVETGPRNEL